MISVCTLTGIPQDQGEIDNKTDKKQFWLVRPAMETLNFGDKMLRTCLKISTLKLNVS